MTGTIEFDLLQLFVTVADAQSFTVAARRLNMPNSSVSRGIARLEEKLGNQLLHRTTRRVALSTAGTALYERTAPLLRALHEAVGTMPEREDAPSGDLRITAPNDIGQTFLAEMIPLFVRRYPSVRVDVRLTNRTVDLVAEGFDLAIRAWSKAPQDTSLVMRRFSPTVFQLFASPSYLARRGTPRSANDAQQHDWVLFRNEWPAKAFGLSQHARIVSDDLTFIRSTLRNGAGIGPLPSFLAQPDLATGDLVRVLPRHFLEGSRFVLLHPKARHVPSKVTAFRDFLLEHLAVRPLAPRPT